MAASRATLSATTKDADNVHHDVRADRLAYQSGFGNEHASEALVGALPEGRNNPQQVCSSPLYCAMLVLYTLPNCGRISRAAFHPRPTQCPYGLYAEQLSGTAFTAPRATNQRTWLYRINPSTKQSRFMPSENPTLLATRFDGDAAVADPNQMRWGAPHVSHGSGKDFVDSLATMCGNGDPTTKTGLAVHIYACDASMADTAMTNSDGDMLIVPQQGVLHLQTELGFLDVSPREIVVVPRGILFRVSVDGLSRGYVLEVFGSHFKLPELGPIGANGLANARDFQYPVAAFEDRTVDYVIVNKYGGRTWTTTRSHSPFDVVAWHGNYAPFKYNLDRFCTMNSVSYDHPDPSIYTGACGDGCVLRWYYDRSTSGCSSRH